MNFSNASRFFGALAGTLLLSSFASAASITGNFSLDGTALDTATSISFGFIVPPTTPGSGDQLAVIVEPHTGSFAGLTNGTTAGISNLTTTSFANWITLPDGINVDLTSIPINTGVGVCSGSDAVGTICRPFMSSPVVLEQGPSGVSALVNFDGTAHYATGTPDDTPIVGKFSASLGGETISSILGMINAGGAIQVPYSANFVTSPSPVVPEPASMALIGCGLLGLGFFGRKKMIK